MKKLIVAMTITLLITGSYWITAFAAEEPKGPTDVTNFGKKPKVTFKHDTHKKNLKCVSCHHKEESNNYKCGTSDCHQAKAKGKTTKIKDAAHKKKIGKCWGCHFKASPKATKPMKCNECHVKK